MHTARVALLADIHGNSPALQATLEDIEQENCSEIFVLGDMINGIDPGGSIRMLREWAYRCGVRYSCIKGNAEAYLTTPDLESLPGKNEAWNRNLLALMKWYENHLSPSDLGWIHSFPDTIRWHKAYLVHDSPLDRLAVQTQVDATIPPQYAEWFYHGCGITPRTSQPAWQAILQFMDKENFQQIFCGHTHEPFIRETGGKIICNVGSVGAPVDGDPRPAWVLAEINSSAGISISLHRVTYEIALIHQMIDNTPDYPDFQNIPGSRHAYKKWLLTGIHWREHLTGNGI